VFYLSGCECKGVGRSGYNPSSGGASCYAHCAVAALIAYCWAVNLAGGDNGPYVYYYLLAPTAPYTVIAKE